MSKLVGWFAFITLIAIIGGGIFVINILNRWAIEANTKIDNHELFGQKPLEDSPHHRK